MRDDCFAFELRPDTENVDVASERHGHALAIDLEGPERLRLEWFNWDGGAPDGSRLYEFTRVE